MPPGTPYDSLIPPYNIRVDAFTDTLTRRPALHLLTHTHSDHIVGLSTQSFASSIICSHDSKEILLRHQIYKERALYDDNLRSEPVRTFKHLKVDPRKQPDGRVVCEGSKDLLRPLPLNTPTSFELDGCDEVTITLIDANHCPGSVMFLIEGPRGAILHTGDFRAEYRFIETIVQNPYLRPYLNGVGDKKLDTIYLDTASVLCPLFVPSKKEATDGLTELMALCPPDAFFFINAWTWGYEDILKAISHRFKTRVHVDRYKHTIFSSLSDNTLREIVTKDPHATRFHACERFTRCEYVNTSFANSDELRRGAQVIYVNPVTMSVEQWQAYTVMTRELLKNGGTVSNLLVPLSRHSPLPELQTFVSLFRPRRMVPNTLIPALRGLDWIAIQRMFKDCVSENIVLHSPTSSQTGTALMIDEDEDLRDPALKNLDGDGAQTAALRWAENSKLVAKLQVMQMFVEGPELAFVQGVINRRNAQARLLARGRSSVHAVSLDDGDEDDSQGSLNDKEYDYANTAHILFGAFADVQGTAEDQDSSSLSSASNPNQTLSPNFKRNGSMNQQTHVYGPLGSPTSPSTGKRQNILSTSPKQRALSNISNRSRLHSPSTSHSVDPTPHDSVNVNPALPTQSEGLPTPGHLLVTVQSDNESIAMSENGSAYPSPTASPKIKRAIPAQVPPELAISPQKYCTLSRSEAIEAEMTVKESAADNNAQDSAHKRALKALRLSIAERLCAARPDLASPAFIAKQNRRQARRTTSSGP